MRQFVLLMLISTLTLSAADGPVTIGRTLADTDFGTADRPADVNNSAQGRITGVLPAGWRDDSSWAKVTIDYARGVDEARHFLRIDVKRIESGQGQVAFALPDAPGEAIYRLDLTARTLTATPLRVGLRFIGAPWQTLWEAMPPLTASWSSQSLTFTATRGAEPAGIWLWLPQAGQVDIKTIRLRQLSRDELVADLRARHPAGGPVNLLRNTRLPLGLQAGWSLERDRSDGDEVRLTSDVAGPSGSAALRVRTPAGVSARIFSEPFAPVLALDPHLGSVQVSGSGRVTLFVHCDGKRIAERGATVEPGKGWTPVSVSFTPTLLSSSCTLALAVEGDVLVDAWQAHDGTTPRPWSAGHAHEVALALPPSAADVARVQFHDEPARLRWLVSPAPALGTVLRLRVVNAYGDEHDLKPIALKGAEGVMDYAVFTERPFGCQRIEAWVEDGAGAKLSPINELVVTRLRRPRHWGEDAPASPFGVHVEATTRHLLMAKAVGMNWVRLHDAGSQYTQWAKLERKPGAWTFTDAGIDRYRRHRMSIFGQLGTAPKWASKWSEVADPSGSNGYFMEFMQPKDLKDYAHYVDTVTRRYQGKVAAWFVWNEPWHAGWWTVDWRNVDGEKRLIKGATPREDFARLQRSAWDAVKAVDRAVTVVGINTTSGAGAAPTKPYGSYPGSAWTEGVVAAGGLATCDVIDYHHYCGTITGFPGDEVERAKADTLAPVVAAKGRLDRPVWMSEGSAVPGWVRYGLYRHALPYHNGERALAVGDRECRYVLSLLANGVERVFLYSMHAHDHLGSGGHLAGAALYMTVNGEDGYLHPVGAGLSALAWHLEGTGFARRRAVAADTYAYLFTTAGGERSVAAISSLSGVSGWVLPQVAGLEWRDLYGNPLGAGATFTGTLAFATLAGPLEQLDRALAPVP